MSSPLAGEGEGRLLVMSSRAPSSGEKSAWKVAQQLERQMLNERQRTKRERARRAGGGESHTAAACSR